MRKVARRRKCASNRDVGVLIGDAAAGVRGGAGALALRRRARARGGDGGDAASWGGWRCERRGAIDLLSSEVGGRCFMVGVVAKRR